MRLADLRLILIRLGTLEQTGGTTYLDLHQEDCDRGQGYLDHVPRSTFEKIHKVAQSTRRRQGPDEGDPKEVLDEYRRERGVRCDNPYRPKANHRDTNEYEPHLPESQHVGVRGQYGPVTLRSQHALPSFKHGLRSLEIRSLEISCTVCICADKALDLSDSPTLLQMSTTANQRPDRYQGEEYGTTHLERLPLLYRSFDHTVIDYASALERSLGSKHQPLARIPALIIGLELDNIESSRCRKTWIAEPIHAELVLDLGICVRCSVTSVTSSAMRIYQGCSGVSRLG